MRGIDIPIEATYQVYKTTSLSLRVKEQDVYLHAYP